MPNPILPIPAFPDVPFALGVPPVLRNLSNDIDTVNAVIDQLTGDAPGLTDNSTSPQWGLFDSQGQQAVSADSVVAFEYRKEWRVPNYPQEQGAFQSYNKVELPGEPRLMFTKGGAVSDRTQFLTDCDTVCASTDLFQVFTPEASYDSVNPISYNIMQRKADNGATLITVEMFLEEIRVTATQQFSSSPTTPANPTQTAQPSGQAPTSTGAVLAQTPTPSQTAAASGVR
jgi:hypothetical protein